MGTLLRIRTILVLAASVWAAQAPAADAPAAGTAPAPTAAPAGNPPAPPADGMPPAASISTDSYDQALKNIFTFTPDQVEQAKKQNNEIDKAVQSRVMPQIVSRTVNVDLTAGSPSPVIHLTSGLLTSLLFTDATGAAWPINSQHTGDGRVFDVEKPDGLQPGNMLVVSPVMMYGSTNLLVTLTGLDAPVMVILEASNEQPPKGPTDGRVTLRIQQQGPMAIAPVVSPTVTQPVSGTLTSFLDGTPPGGAQPADITPAWSGVRVWVYQGSLYVRSIYPLHWPAYFSFARGIGDVWIYKTELAPYIKLYRDGQESSLSLTLPDGTQNGQGNAAGATP